MENKFCRNSEKELLALRPKSKEQPDDCAGTVSFHPDSDVGRGRIKNGLPLTLPLKRESGERTEKDWLIDNMAMLIRTLTYSLSKVEKYRKKSEAANDFLIRHNLQGSPLRNDIEGDKA